MNQYVKMCIDGRKQAMMGTFELDEGAREKVEGLFVEIEKLGAECGDAGEFEAKLAASPLNKRYMDLFTELATTASSGVAGGTVEGATQNVAGGIVGEVARDTVRNAVGGAVPTTRAAVHQKAHDAARDVPVLGDAINIGQKASYLAHLGRVLKKKGK